MSTFENEYFKKLPDVIRTAVLASIIRPASDSAEKPPNCVNHEQRKYKMIYWIEKTFKIIDETH